MSKLLETHALLEWARDLGKAYPFFDCHVHPFDVLTGDIAYQRNKQFEMLFSNCNSAYHQPVVDYHTELETQSPTSPRDSERAVLLASRFKYVHTGSKVIVDQLNAAGLSGALLLPVARVPGKSEELLEASKEMFQCGGSLYTACAFPLGVPAHMLSSFFMAARQRYQIRAIKIHPNLAGIDPSTSEGHDLMDATLEAADALNLPIIIHVGRTSTLKPCDSAEYGTLSHLKAINWSRSTSPVIFGHAGCYELTEAETDETLCQLNSLFEKYPNLMADTSNLQPSSLRAVLRRVSRDRLLFGSDALYVPIWKSWLIFLYMLQDTSLFPDNDLVCIASLNPVGCLGLSSTQSLLS